MNTFFYRLFIFAVGWPNWHESPKRFDGSVWGTALNLDESSAIDGSTSLSAEPFVTCTGHSTITNLLRYVSSCSFLCSFQFSSAYLFSSFLHLPPFFSSSSGSNVEKELSSVDFSFNLFSFFKVGNANAPWPPSHPDLLTSFFNYYN